MTPYEESTVKNEDLDTLIRNADRLQQAFGKVVEKLAGPAIDADPAMFHDLRKCIFESIGFLEALRARMLLEIAAKQTQQAAQKLEEILASAKTSMQHGQGKSEIQGQKENPEDGKSEQEALSPQLSQAFTALYETAKVTARETLERCAVRGQEFMAEFNQPEQETIVKAEMKQKALSPEFISSIQRDLRSLNYEQGQILEILGVVYKAIATNHD
jgi:hypothetical protein